VTKKISDIEQEGFVGCDASLSISLLEYGLAWKKDPDRGWRFYYNLSGDRFSWGSVTCESFEQLVSEFSWADFADVSKCSGVPLDVYKQSSVPSIVSDLVQYYGRENVFGSCYDEGFQIVDA